ncbi:ABC transporter substrate-binding protein [Campylobacter sp. RM12642]|nr:ABC transporter substrate-binding protein [Campylobacter sp. RM12642]
MLRFILLFLLSFSLFAKEITFKDVTGNEITLNTPVNRIALGFYYTDFLAVGGEKSFDKVVGFSKAVWSEWSPISWQMYLDVMPNLDKIADFGEAESGTLSIEKILELEPDVLVLAKWQYDTLKDTLNPIKLANIPIIVVDYHEGKLQNHEISTKIFGILTNQEKRAEEIMNNYKSRLELIQARTKDIKNKVKVYIEYGINGPSDNGVTYSHYMWGSLIDKANAKSIADGFIKTWGAINPEEIIVQDPEVIIIAGRESELKKNKTSMVMGNNISFDEANNRLRGFSNRTTWQDLNAVKNHRIYGGYHSMLRTLGDIFMLEFVAKAAYPELFSDINPSDDYINYHKKYLPIIPDGTFMLKLDDEKF